MELLSLVWTGLRRVATETLRVLPWWALMLLLQSATYLFLQHRVPSSPLAARLVEHFMATVVAVTVLIPSVRLAADVRRGTFQHQCLSCRLPVAVSVGHTLGDATMAMVYGSILMSTLLLLSRLAVTLPDGTYFLAIVAVIGAWGLALVLGAVIAWWPRFLFVVMALLAAMISSRYWWDLGAGDVLGRLDWWLAIVLVPAVGAMQAARLVALGLLSWVDLAGAGVAAVLFLAGLLWLVVGALILHRSTERIARLGRWPRRGAS